MQIRKYTKTQIDSWCRINVACSRWIVQLRLNLGSPMAGAGRLHTAMSVMRNTRNVQGLFHEHTLPPKFQVEES